MALVYLLLRAGQGDDGVQDGNGYELAGPGSGDVAEVVAAEDAGDDLDVEIFGERRICRADDADDLYAALLGVAGVLQDVPGAAGVHDDEQQVVLVHHTDLHGLEDEVLYAAAGYGELEEDVVGGAADGAGAALADDDQAAGPGDELGGLFQGVVVEDLVELVHYHLGVADDLALDGAGIVAAAQAHVARGLDDVVGGAVFELREAGEAELAAKADDGGRAGARGFRQRIRRGSRQAAGVVEYIFGDALV